jgi:hypothetical protein
VPLVVAGFHLFGLRGAVAGWLAAEAITRGTILVRAGQLLGGMRTVLPWRTLSIQAFSAAAAVPAGALALRFTHGPALLRLAACGTAMAIVYLAALRATGELPPVRDWIPRRRPPEAQPSLAA